ncbi:MAG: coproporphyrinogen dehydrogenase, partial [Gordonibacter sp.]
MLTERMLTAVVRQTTKNYLQLKPTTEVRVPGPRPGMKYMLYMHVPFCERLCPYCSFNRFPFSEDRARPYFASMRKEMQEVSSETNPNHLIPEYLDKLQGRVQRLSVGVQSFDNGLLKQMDRFDKYGCAEEILERVGQASPYFTSMNVDMIFNFPAQTEDILINDVERVIESGA